MHAAQTQAEQFGFIIVAPDSRTADFSGWSVPSADEPPSQDMLHTQVGGSENDNYQCQGYCYDAVLSGVLGL